MGNRLNILHLRASNFVGGPEKQILEHLKRIDRQQFTPLLCSFSSDGKSNDLVNEAVSVGIHSLVLENRCPTDPGIVRRLRRILLHNSVRIIVTHGYKPNIVGYWAVKGLGIPQIIYSHGWTGESAKIRLYEYLDCLTIKRVRNIVAVSEGHKRQLESKGVPKDRITVIHNAVVVPDKCEHMSLRCRYSLPKDATLVVSAGRLSPEKNFAGLIEASAPILRQRKNTFFLVLGEGALRKELERQIALADLQGRFLLPGFTADVPSLLADADIFVSSSHTEGLPVAVLEGAGAGLPVVATAVGGTPEVVRDGDNGFLVPAGDVTSLGNAIERLLARPDVASKMGARGAAMVRERFNFESHAHKLEALYRSVAHTC